MAYNAVPTVTTGDTWSAANHNTYIRDNFAAGVPDIITAAGDIVYGTAANVADVLPIGTTNQALICSSDGLPAWGNVPDIDYRQGSSTDSNWNVPGTTNFTPTDTLVQAGVCQMVFSNHTYSDQVTVTFPVAFSAIPIVIFSASLKAGPTGGQPALQFTLDTYAHAKTVSTVTFDGYGTENMTATFYINWIAIGPA